MIFRSVLIGFGLNADISLVQMYELLDPLSRSIQDSQIFTVAKTVECRVNSLEVVLTALILFPFASGPHSVVVEWHNILIYHKVVHGVLMHVFCSLLNYIMMTYVHAL